MSKRVRGAGAAIGVAAVMVLALSACSGGNSFPVETVEGFFGPLGKASPSDQGAASEFAAPGSVAEKYVIEQVAHAQAQQDGGTLSAETQEVVIDGESVFLCLDGYDEKDSQKADFCVEYSNLVFDDNEKIVSFDAGDAPLEGRISLGDGSVVPIADVGNVTYLSSYVTISGDLVVVVEVSSNADPLTILSYDATYVAEDGRPTTIKYSDGPSELKNERLANFALVFPNVGLGGVLELKFMDADYNNFAVEIPTAK